MFRVVLQLLIPMRENSVLPPSGIVKAGMLPVAFMVYGLFTYALLALVFLLIQDRMAGTKTIKGLTFGLLFGMMWVIYLFEPLPHSAGAPFLEVLAYPLADGLSLVVLGLLLGKFMGVDVEPNGKECSHSSIIALVSIAISFTVVRFLSYQVIQIYSSFADRPLETIAWAIIMGIWIGVMYLYLRTGKGDESPLIKAVYFGFLVFGIDLFFFNFFVVLVFAADVFDLFVRTMIDIVSVVMGVYFAEQIPFVRMKQRNKANIE